MGGGIEGAGVSMRYYSLGGGEPTDRRRARGRGVQLLVFANDRVIPLIWT